MMGRKHREQASLFYEFRLDDMIPKGHLLRRINVFVTSVLGDLHEQLGPFYSDIGRPSIDPELLIRMLIIGYSASAPRGSYARRSGSTSHTGGSAGSISMTPFPTTRPSPRTG
jgi:hypothetical protein